MRSLQRDDAAMHVGDHSHHRWSRPLWTTSFVLNLILPVWFGFSATSDGGRVGMFIGIVVMYALGALSVERWPGVRFTLPVGGLFIAMSQLALMPHVYLGVGVLRLTEPVPNSEIAG